MKKIIDFFGSLVLLVFFSPLLLVISLHLYLFHDRKVFFIQERVGLHGRIFSIIKFRTMADITDRNGNLLPDGDRLTRFGYWLRTLSLDELPQLINVLKGEMSLVGPRPLLVEYWPLYNNFQRRRHEVLPGITGWAQVNGRNGLNWSQKFQYDIWYVNNQSLMLDLKVIFMTVATILQRKNISQDGQVSCEKFKGNPKELMPQNVVI